MHVSGGVCESVELHCSARLNRSVLQLVHFTTVLDRGGEFVFIAAAVMVAASSNEPLALLLLANGSSLFSCC